MQSELTEARIPFEVPRGLDLAVRLASVLEVIYLVFNEGYSATAGDDWMRPALCDEALRLGRILAELAPNEPEVHGLVALMEIHLEALEAHVAGAGLLALATAAGRLAEAGALAAAHALLAVPRAVRALQIVQSVIVIMSFS